MSAFILYKYYFFVRKIQIFNLKLSYNIYSQKLLLLKNIHFTTRRLICGESSCSLIGYRARQKQNIDVLWESNSRRDYSLIQGIKWFLIRRTDWYLINQVSGQTLDFYRYYFFCCDCRFGIYYQNIKCFRLFIAGSYHFNWTLTCFKTRRSRIISFIKIIFDFLHK